MCGNSRGSQGPSVSMDELYARSKRDTDQRQYEAETEELLRELLTDFNNRDVEAINNHLSTVENALSKDIEGIVDLAFGGSLSKNTFVQGISDADLLVCLNDTSLEKKNPKEMLVFFEKMLRERLPHTEIKQGDLAVTVKFSDGLDIQLLPAIKTATGYRISQPDKSAWSNVVRPDLFAKKLTEVNKSCNGRVIPVIKLVKPMCEKFPKPLRLAGYHLESLAIHAFENYKGRTTLQEMVKHFLYSARAHVLHPIADKTGQSRHVDDYLGADNSSLRSQVSTALGRLITKIERAEHLRSSDNWKELIEI